MEEKPNLHPRPLPNPTADPPSTYSNVQLPIPAVSTTSASDTLGRTQSPHESPANDDATKQAISGILDKVKTNFESNILQAEALSRANGSDDVEANSASVNAHKLNGLTLAIERLLSDSFSSFQTLVVSRAEAHSSTADSRTVELDSGETTPVEIEVPEPSESVFLEPISSLDHGVLNIAPKATPNRYRFIDCSRLVHHFDLRIIEYPCLEDIPFATTSYIWRGVIGPSMEHMSRWGSFAVAEATDGDPISIDILLHIARACLLDKIPLMWLDRLCIIQSNEEDKAWQIQHMYGLYTLCQKCYILPGGTRRLADLEEPNKQSELEK